MGTARGKEVYVAINGVDLSEFIDSSEHHTVPDIVDITTYGKDWHEKESTLLDGNGSIGGIYDTSTSVGPRAVLEAIVGQRVAMVRRIEGTGAGKPELTRDVIIGEYVETAPVGEIVRWTCALEYTGAPTPTTQS